MKKPLHSPNTEPTLWGRRAVAALLVFGGLVAIVGWLGTAVPSVESQWQRDEADEDPTDPPASPINTCDSVFLDSLPDAHAKVPMLMPSYEIPSRESTDVRHAVQLRSESDEEVYVVAFEPVVENPDIVHHMFIHQCAGDLSGLMGPTTEKKPFQSCKEVVAGYGLGGGPTCMPPGVGIMASPSAWFSLEVHYSNPQLSAGIRDSSGFRLTTVPVSVGRSRNYQEAAVSHVAINTHDIRIPPGHDAYKISGDCSFRAPPSGVRVIWTFPHAHSIATKVWTEVRRDVGEPARFDLGCIERYDFHKQEILSLPESQTIYPTDKITQHCVYDSSDRAEVTNGGGDTMHEMCSMYFLFYPAQSHMNCQAKHISSESGGGDHTCNWPFRWPDGDIERGQMANEDNGSPRNIEHGEMANDLDDQLPRGIHSRQALSTGMTDVRFLLVCGFLVGILGGTLYLRGRFTDGDDADEDNSADQTRVQLAPLVG